MRDGGHRRFGRGDRARRGIGDGLPIRRRDARASSRRAPAPEREHVGGMHRGGSPDALRSHGRRSARRSRRVPPTRRRLAGVRAAPWPGPRRAEGRVDDTGRVRRADRREPRAVRTRGLDQARSRAPARSPGQRAAPTRGCRQRHARRDPRCDAGVRGRDRYDGPGDPHERDRKRAREGRRARRPDRRAHVRSGDARRRAGAADHARAPRRDRAGARDRGAVRRWRRAVVQRQQQSVCARTA